MKYKIEIDNNLSDDEIIIKCNENINSSIDSVMLNNISKISKLASLKDDKEYYLSLEDILFFETSGIYINAHTLNEIYRVKYKLYELVNILPNNFIRISKSSIVNINHIYSITKNITSSSIIEFKKSYKKVYVSRLYFKELNNRLKERK